MRHLILTAVCCLSFGIIQAGESLSVPITFDLDKPATVTVVIEDANGKRVRNLAGAVRLPPGKNLLSWDGYDDGDQHQDGSTVRHLVAPGRYTARGVTSDGLRLIYEFPFNSPGDPPWFTKDRRGAWLADHTSPQAVVSVPASDTGFLARGKSRVIVSAITAECGDAFMALDLDGKKIIGNNDFGWTGAYALSVDQGPQAPKGEDDPWLYCLVPEDKTVKLNVFTRTGKAATALRHQTTNPVTWNGGQTGDAVTAWNGVAVISVPHDHVLLVVDARRDDGQRLIGSIPFKDPRGVLFDAQGRLLVATAKQVKRLTVDLNKAVIIKDDVLIANDLDDAQQLAVDQAGNLYVGDWGKLHVIKQFNSAGKLTRTIGKPGGPRVGAFDDEQMFYPKGLAIDERNNLWVAGADHLPKRITVWSTADGKLVRSLIGGPGYGGGGTLDPEDRTVLRYGLFNGAYTMRLDWVKGTARVESIHNRLEQWNGLDRDRVIGGPPEEATHIGEHTFLLNNFCNGLRGNPNVTSIWHVGKDGVAWPVALVGGLYLQEGTHGGWDAARNPGVKELFKNLSFNHLVIWSDVNRDGRAQPAEFVSWKLPPDYLESARFNPDLSFVVRGYAMPAPTILPNGVPVWDAASTPKLMSLVDPTASDDVNYPRGGLQADDGRLLVLTHGIACQRAGRRDWWYPSQDGASLPKDPGTIVEATGYLGAPFAVRQGEAGTVFGLNGEKGSIYLMTSDGLFLQDIGGDLRVNPTIGQKYPEPKRGMVVEGISFMDEHFHPSLSQTKEGEVILLAGKEFSAIFRVDGLAAVKRRTFATLDLSAQRLAGLPKTLVVQARQQGRLTLMVPVGGTPPAVDGALGDWAADVGWAKLDDRASASLRIVGDRLYAAWRTGDPDVLTNAPGEPKLSFKRGGAVDLMLASDPKTKAERSEPAAGDLRLLVTKNAGKTVAMLYRAVVPGTKEAERIPFISPVGRVDFDRVEDVSAAVQLAQQGGDIELSIPLATLGLKDTKIGATLLGDLGLLRGTGAITTQRLYWNNLNTSICSDVPSEARLQPANWGTLRFISEGMTRRIDAVKPATDLVSGLVWADFEGDMDWNNAETDVTALRPIGRGSAAVPDLAGVRGRKNGGAYAVTYEGFIDIPSEGIWTISAHQDDGLRVRISGQSVLADLASGGRHTTGSPLRLAKGLHPLSIAFVDWGGEAILTLKWSGPGQPEQSIPASAFKRRP